MASAEGKELLELRWKLKQEVEKLKQTQDDWAGQLRASTPQRGVDGGVKRALENMEAVSPQLRTGKGPVDVTSPVGAPIEGVVSPDHLYPVSKICRMKEFEQLTSTQQTAVLELTENYFPLSLRAQSSKGNKTMAEWFKTPVGSQVPQSLRSVLLDAEKRAEQAVRARIQALLEAKK